MTNEKMDLKQAAAIVAAAPHVLGLDAGNATQEEENIIVHTRPRVLLGVEDSEFRASVALALSEDLDCDVHAVADGFRLVEHIADAILDGPQPCRPGLIIVDSMLPGCSGLTLLIGLRQLDWDTPVVLLTPRDDENTRRQAWEHGATGVLTEPFDVRELCILSNILLASFVVEDARGGRLSGSGAQGVGRND